MATDIENMPDPTEQTPLLSQETSPAGSSHGDNSARAARLEDLEELEHERAYNHIEHCQSVYTFMLFMPPLSHKRYGHYFTAHNMLAVALFGMVATVQVSLTLIAGRNIQDDFHQWRMSLVHDRDFQDLVESRVEKVQKQVGKHSGYYTAVDAYEQAKGYVIGGVRESEYGEACCIGVECTNLGLPCCRLQKDELLSGAMVDGVFNGSHDVYEENETAKVPSFFLQNQRKPAGGKKAGGKEEEGSGALCTRVNGTQLTCLPPSANYLGAWDELDENGDGLWNVSEAQMDVANLGCRLGVPAEDIFRSACRGIEIDYKDANEHGGQYVPVPFDVQERQGISHVHFNWFSGVVGLCLMTDVAKCSQLVAKGYFDGAVRHGTPTWKGGIEDLDSAMAYCNRMLQPGGLCDELMPGTYTLFQSRTREKCGAPVFALGERYVNPHNEHDVAGTVDITFQKVDEFDTTHTLQFKFFLTLLVMMWYFNLLEEFKECVNMADFVWNFPVRNVFPFVPPTMAERFCNYIETFESQHPDTGHRVSHRMLNFLHGQLEKNPDSHSKTIEYIARPHQITVFFMLLIRVILCWYMAVVGTVFLFSNHNYIDLLLNAVALAFIFEVDEYIFTCMVSDDTKKELDEVEPLHFKTSLPTGKITGGIFRKELVGLVIAPIVAICVVMWHDKQHIGPVVEALHCLCEHAGEGCVESGQFPKPWWDQYWQFTRMVVPFQGGVTGIGH